MIETENIIDFLAEKGVFASKAEARHLVAGGAIKVNGELITDTKATMPKTLFVTVQKGKNWTYQFLNSFKNK